MVDVSETSSEVGRPPGTTPPRSGAGARAALSTLLRSRFVAIIFLLAIALIFFSIKADGFMSWNNMKSLASGASITWVVALGTTFVMILGNFDLSVGAALTLNGVLLGWLVASGGLPVWAACLVTLAIGTVLGAGLNGMLIGRFGVSFLVVTLGTSWLFQGLVNWVSGTRTIGINDGFLFQVGFGKLFGVPYAVWIMIITFAVAHFVLNRTLFGRDVFAVGGSPQAARLSGIRVTRTIIIVYGISTFAAAFGGILQASRISAASPQVGASVLFDAVAAVLLGGTSFRGGSGTVTGTAVGVLFLATMSNGLGFLGVASFWQQVITGIIVVFAGIAERIQRGGGIRRHRGTKEAPPTPAAATS